MLRKGDVAASESLPFLLTGGLRETSIGHRDGMTTETYARSLNEDVCRFRLEFDEGNGTFPDGNRQAKGIP
jgi:hypothetical protein